MPVGLCGRVCNWLLGATSVGWRHTRYLLSPGCWEVPCPARRVTLGRWNGQAPCFRANSVAQNETVERLKWMTILQHLCRTDENKQVSSTWFSVILGSVSAEGGGGTCALRPLWKLDFLFCGHETGCVKVPRASWCFCLFSGFAQSPSNQLPSNLF